MSAVKLTPFKADLVRAIREVAAEPKNKANGWGVVESFSDTDIAAIFGGCITLKGAIKLVRFALIERLAALEEVASELEIMQVYPEGQKPEPVTWQLPSESALQILTSSLPEMGDGISGW